MDKRSVKLKKLKEILKGLESVVVAYSGGLDSTFLLKVALDTLGRGRVLAVTARSETYPESEYRCAVRMAKELKKRNETIDTKELEIKNFRKNPVNRCYYCKSELFRRLKEMARDNGIKHVVDGANHDDLKDIRYGMKAARELGVRSPLLEAGIGKALIRRSSYSLGLATWSKPSFACLASRIPFGRKIDETTLVRVGRAEEYIRRLGLGQVRLRVHKNVARMEVDLSDFGRVIKSKRQIVKFLKGLGFTYITLDLEGYRTGSMNEPLMVVKAPRL